MQPFKQGCAKCYTSDTFLQFSDVATAILILCLVATWISRGVFTLDVEEDDEFSCRLDYQRFLKQMPYAPGM
jgi:hypothetical protein